MPDDSFREDVFFSGGFFPFAGDLRLTSAAEDLDLPTCSRERPREPAGLTGSDFEASAGGGKAATSAVFTCLFKASLTCPFCLHVLSEAFLKSRALFPKSADRRLSRCLRALLKKDKPFSSDLPPRWGSLADTLGERRLVTEELLLELRTDLRSGRLLSAGLGTDERAATPAR